MKTIAKCLTLALLVLACGTRGDDFRWGNSSKDNKVKYDNNYNSYMGSSGKCRVYLYLGEAKVENNQVSLENLTYICDVAPNSNNTVGDYNYLDTKPYKSSDHISAQGDQKFSLIAVSLYGVSKNFPSGSPIGQVNYYSVAIKTGISVGATDSNGHPYARLVVDDTFVNNDWSMPGSFVMKVEPVSDGGYMWGSSVSGDYRVPPNNSLISSSSARAYLYLGKAEYKNGVINLGNLTYLTNSTPSGHVFGNYETSPTAAKLIQDDRVDPNGGQDFTVFIVTPNGGKFPPNPLAGGYEARYIAIQSGTSTSAVTSDGAKHARMVIGTKAVQTDFYGWKEGRAVPLVDVGGSTFGVY